MRSPKLGVCSVLLLSAACPARDGTPRQTPERVLPGQATDALAAVGDGASPLSDAQAAEAGDPSSICATGRACAEQGLRASDNREYASARRLFERACELNDPLGCRRLSLDLDHDRGPIAPADPARAQVVLEKACELGELDSCGMLATGYLYGNRPGVARDPGRAVQLYRKGCDGGDGACCEGLANCYEDGLGVPKDKALAKKLRKRAAELGYVGE